MEKKIPFEPVVMLVDATYLERVGTDLTEHFAPLVKRELPKADLAVLLECLALDAGVPLGENKVQVIFIYDEADKRFSFCDPSDLEKELHATAFKSQLGEFSLYAFQPSGFATREDLFLESFQLLGESKEVRRVIAVPDEDGYGGQRRRDRVRHEPSRLPREIRFRDVRLRRPSGVGHPC